MNRVIWNFGFSAALSLALPLSGAVAQPPPPAASPAMPLEYAAKFVCSIGDEIPATSSFAAGAYYTAVNVHNPNREAILTYKVALAPLAKPGPITAFRPPLELKYDQAFEIDCRVIAALLHDSGITVPAVYTGFLVIQSRTELDVVAVYTTSAAPGKPVTAFHTERVPVRRVM